MTMKTLGPYKLTRQLGVGGMGEVWKGRRTGVGGASKNVAVKTLLSGRSGDEKLRKMFIDEARLSMLLTNSNIVQVFDVDVADDGTCYMAMEWIDGIDLSKLGELLREQGETLPHDLSAFIIGEVLKALAYAHEFEVEGELKTLVHRDISPHNVMVSITGEIKLMDFGVARLAGEETSGLHVKGKLRYMPPEQMGGESSDPRIDLFAVGAVFHELLSGAKFRGEVFDQAHLYGVVLGGQYRPLSKELGVPDELRELVDALLATKPEDRPVSARAAHRQLATWSGYRDGKFDLEDLVRRFARRPTLNSVPPGSTKTDPLGGSATEKALPRAAEDDSGSQTELASIAKDDAPAASSPTRAKPSPLILAGTLLAMGVGVFGIGTKLAWWLGEDAPVAASSTADPAPSKPAAPAPDPAPIPDAEPAPDPEPDPDPDDGDTELPEPPSAETGELGDTDSSETGETGETPPEPDVAAPVKVTLTLEGSRTKYVNLKLGGRSFELEYTGTRSKSTRLKPGSYSLRYSQAVNGKWQSGGSVVIPSGGPVKLVFDDGKLRKK